MQSRAPKSIIYRWRERLVYSSRNRSRALLHVQQSETPTASLFKQKVLVGEGVSLPTARVRSTLSARQNQGFSPIPCTPAPRDLGQALYPSSPPHRWMLTALPFIPGHPIKSVSSPTGVSSWWYPTGVCCCSAGWGGAGGAGMNNFLI